MKSSHGIVKPACLAAAWWVAQLWVSFSDAENGGMHQPLRSQCEFRRGEPTAVTLTWSSRKYPSAMLRGRCWDPAMGGRGDVGKSCVDTATPHGVSVSEQWVDCMSVGGC